MPTFFNVDAIAEQLEARQLVICSNQRLARRIEAAYGIYWQQQGRSVIIAPRVYALEGWIQSCWNQLMLRAHLKVLADTVLTSDQELLLWEQIISNSEVALLRPAATAQQASAAYRTLHLWRQDLSDPKVRRFFIDDEDSATFLGWVEKFEQYCAEHAFIPAVKTAQILLDLYQSGEIENHESVLLVGFESISPLEEALLRQVGSLELHSTERKSAEINIIARDSERQEISTAALWAKQQLKNKPGQTVAVVIPDLAQQRTRVQRIFQEVFEPEFSDPATTRKSLPFNLSAGYPLIEAPVIAAAVDALSIYLPEIDVRLCQSILASPFYALGSVDEENISRLMDGLYELRRDRISAARFRNLVESVSVGSTSAPWHFSAILQKQATLVRTNSTQATPSQWGKLFSNLLDVIGWPGQRSLDSDEYQQVAQWQLLQESINSLDPILGKINYSQAIHTLTGFLSRQLFQSETADSSLQVLGTLEAAGLQFDHLWLMSMSDKQWPADPNPNPLLPYALQRDCNMPHATAARELTFANNLVSRFRASAGNIVASYCSQQDGNSVRVSSLLGDSAIVGELDILGKPLQRLLPIIEIRRRHMESIDIEIFDAGQGPPVTADEIVRGGSSLFARQSVCPFMAFARHRLHLQKPPITESGLNAADRGSLLHRALEMIWLSLKDRAGLLALTSEAQHKLCASAADFSLNEIEAKKPGLIGPNLRKLEIQRISNLLQAWLDIEKQRNDFKINALEARYSFRSANPELETRMDRIDELADGSLLIID